ncbi:hypothetical protein [Clostridium culturomicium]|uniref:hypothetical protein n=1 Tax=Clostridium culturomicium TaxID=1499683 RepID=UPI00058C7367|nr:hypothetical protein [Clostridium culturomicium]
MQATSAEYKLEIKKPSRSFECKITIGNNVYFNEDIVDIILETVQPNEGYSIGNTTSQSLELTLINKGDTIYSASQIKLEIGLRVGSTIEYILMGYYNIDEVEKTDYTTKITAFDNMIKFETPYFSSLGEIATLQQIVNELSTITGVQFTGSLPAYTVKKLEGFTCREVLGYVASLCGGNAHITRDGKFTIIVPKEVNYSITGDNYFDYKREEVKYKIGKISCKAEDKEFTKGTLGTDSMELQFENPWVTEAILTDIYNKLNGFSYLGYSMKWQGDLSLDAGDIVSVTDIKGVLRKVPILSQKFTYTGGLTCEIGAKGESKNKNSFNSSGSGTNKLDRVVTELLLVKEALIDKANIQELEAVQIRTQTLEAKTATIEKAIIDVAHISDLTAINAKIENLVAEDVKINKALIDKATIGDLNALNAKIVTMEVSIGKIGTLEANLATIQTLVNGNLTSDNIQSLVLTASKVTVENGFIKNAMIESLDVAKVNAGDISTNKFRIVSDSGRMVMADNTIQISDATRVRVQIGKDALNDYNMYVWDSSGKLMFDATGLKAEGIKSKIIRDDMISDTANINSSKLNMISIITSINNGTTTINSSKILIDGTTQTLNIAFTSLNSKVDGVKSTTDSNTTAINAQQGKIDALIANTTIIKDGVTTQLKDAYNATVLKVDSIQSTIGIHTTQISDVTGKVTGVEAKVNDVKRDLDGTVSIVSGHTTQINGLSSTVNTQGASISQLQNQIKLKVESSEVTSIAQNVVNGVALSSRNIVLNSTLNIVDNTSYNTTIINLSKSLEANKRYTMVIRGKVTGTQKLGLWANGGSNCVGYTTLTTTLSTVVFKFITPTTINSSWTSKLSFYNYPSTGVAANPASIEWVTLYEGDVKPSLDWIPAPEDTDSAIDGVYDNISKVESKITQKYEAAIKIAEGNITNSISEMYTTKNEFGEFVSGEFSNIKQDVNSVRTEIGSVETRVEEVNGDLVNYQTLVATYMQFTEIGLEIGKSNSKFRALLDNEKLAFTQDNTIVSYISNNKMYITDAEILGRLTVGQAPLGFWDWSQRSNGNFGLQWRAQ